VLMTWQWRSVTARVALAGPAGRGGGSLPGGRVCAREDGAPAAGELRKAQRHAPRSMGHEWMHDSWQAPEAPYGVGQHGAGAPCERKEAQALQPCQGPEGLWELLQPWGGHRSSSRVSCPSSPMLCRGALPGRGRCVSRRERREHRAPRCAGSACKLGATRDKQRSPESVHRASGRFARPRGCSGGSASAAC